MNDEEQKGDNNFIFVSANYDLEEKDMDGKHDTLELTYEDLNDALEVSEDDSCSSEEKDIKGEHPSPDMNVELALEDEESSHEGTASPGIFFPDGCGSNAEENEQVLDDYEVSIALKTDDKPENENILAYEKRNMVIEVKAILENPKEICEDEAKNYDGYQFHKPEAIKMLFKGSFSKNSREIMENMNKLNKIYSVNNKEDGLKDFPSPEDESCMDISTLEIPVENVNLIDTDGALSVEESETDNEEFEGQTESNSKPFKLRTGSDLEKLV